MPCVRPHIASGGMGIGDDMNFTYPCNSFLPGLVFKLKLKAAANFKCLLLCSYFLCLSLKKEFPALPRVSSTVSGRNPGESQYRELLGPVFFRFFGRFWTNFGGLFTKFGSFWTKFWQFLQYRLRTRRRWTARVSTTGESASPAATSWTRTTAKNKEDNTCLIRRRVIKSTKLSLWVQKRAFYERKERNGYKNLTQTLNKLEKCNIYLIHCRLFHGLFCRRMMIKLMCSYMAVRVALFLRGRSEMVTD